MPRRGARSTARWALLLVAAAAVNSLAGHYLHRTPFDTETRRHLETLNNQSSPCPCACAPELTPPHLALLPPFFDWGAYLFFNPDLGQLSHAQAAAHYLAAGRTEGRLARRLPLFLFYRPYHGLCNQFFHHIEALAYARGFLPHAMVTGVAEGAWGRQSFGARVSEYAQQPLESLLDWPRVVARLRDAVGLTLAKSANTSECVRIDLWTKPSHDLTALTDRLQFTGPVAAAVTAGLIRNETRALLLRDPDVQPCVHLNLGYPGLANFLLNRPAEWAAPIARAICMFAPDVERAAEAVLRGIEARGHTAFHSAHLRIEQDWLAARHIKGGEDVMLRAYFEVMRQAGFTGNSAVFAASGVFDYKNSSEVAALKAKFRAAGVCGELLHKGELVEPGLLAGFSPEQLALVDLLVLARGEVMVGHSLSTFSVFAREYRALLLGLPKTTFYSVVDDKRAHLSFGPPYPT